MKVNEIMSRDVEVIHPDSVIQEAAGKMKTLDVGSLPVCDNRRLLGVVTDRDIAVRGVAQGHGPDTPVRELMSDGLICARKDDDVDEVAMKMADAQVRRLPVIDQDDRLCGIVSLGDLSREATDTAASQALEGVTQPGGEHSQ